MFLTYKFRVKDATCSKRLLAHSRSVNVVWNYCCEIQKEAERRYRGGAKVRWPTAFDLCKLCVGVTTELNLHSDTVQSVCLQFASSRDAKRKCPRFRSSGGPRRSLGWVPFLNRSVKVNDDTVLYLKHRYRFWKSRTIPIDVFKCGVFVQDARGRWYVTFQCDVSEVLPTGRGTVGIDLGLKNTAVLSSGAVIPAQRYYQKYQSQLASQQRAKNKHRVRAIHAKIANARKHYLHGVSSRIARENALIVVGNVSSAKLSKTRLAKFVLDAGWGMLRSQLAYKARRHGARYIEADERWTSVTCSSCNARSGPKGIAGLRIRSWVCSECGCIHDRDQNAALNILRFGLECQAPVEGISAAKSGKTLNRISSQKEIRLSR